MRRLDAATPILIACYLALLLLGPTAHLPDRRADLVGTLLLFSATGAACWLVTACLVDGRPRRVIAGTLLVMGIGLFGTARLILLPKLPHSLQGTWVFLAVWWAPILILVVLVRRSPPPSGHTLRTLTLAALLLCGFQGAGLVRRSLRAAGERSRVAAAPTPDRRDATRPDIVIIVADMFSSPRSMREYYGVDLDWFTDSLEHLGFTLPTKARTNYAHTGLVLASMLNWRLVHNEPVAQSEEPWRMTSQLIRDAQAWSVLKEHGYRLAFFPTGYEGTREIPAASIILTPPKRPFARFGQTWWLNTPAELLRGAGCRGAACAGRSTFPIPIEGPEALRWKLAALQTLPDSAGPVAAFLHFMGSHEPFVFRRDCSPREPWWPRAVNGPDSLEIRQAYADQIECVAGLLLEAVSGLIARSRVPPVVLLQSDHGNGSIRIDPLNARTVGIGEATQRQLRERLEVMAAYRFPSASEVVPDTVTPASALARALNATLNLRLPLPPEESFWSTWQAPLQLTPLRWVGDSILFQPANAASVGPRP